MILFLSESFLRRLQLIWKSSLAAFLIGHRNLYFFAPDSLIEVAEISPSTIDAFLKEKRIPNDWQLLGFVAPQSSLQLAGYVRVETGGKSDAAQWKATIALLVESELRDMALEIRQSKVEQITR
jgi:hypothetical protein